MKYEQVIVASFASARYARSLAGLVNSARAAGFGRFMGYRPESLPQSTRSAHGLHEGVRGCGYWLWKPMIILDALRKAAPGELVLYVDAGNSFFPTGFDLLLDLAIRQDVTLFDNRDSHPQGRRNLNCHWTKRDCFSLLDCDTPEYWFSPQVNAAYQIYRRSPSALSFVEEYLHYCLQPSALNDEPSTRPNLPGYREHRHDQSVLSLLAHKHQVALLPDPSDCCALPPKAPYPALFNHHRGRSSRHKAS